MIERKTGTRISLIPNWSIVSVLLLIISSLITIGVSYGAAINRISVLEKKQSELEVFFTEHVKEQNRIVAYMVRSNDEIIYNLRTISKKLHHPYEKTNE